MNPSAQVPQQTESDNQDFSAAPHTAAPPPANPSIDRLCRSIRPQSPFRSESPVHGLSSAPNPARSSHARNLRTAQQQSSISGNKRHGGRFAWGPPVHFA